MPTLLTLLSGALLLAWPALVNGYPIVFSDTGGFVEMGALPDMGWDKPWTYGPLLLVFHGRTTLWLPALAQCLALSWTLWAVQRAVRPQASRVRHLLACGVLAVGSAAPWFAPLLMPDTFAPIAALCVFLLAFGGRLTRLERTAAAVVGTAAVAVHLAHLVLAAGCLATCWLLRLPHEGWRRPDWRPAVPLGGALVLLLLINAAGLGVLGISPYGSLFMLARLVADGPAARVIDQECARPDAPAWRVCGWAGRLPTDSDEFLWHPDGPVWGGGRGPLTFAAEASRIVALTVREDPAGVALAMLANTLRQLPMAQVGDVLGPQHLDVAVLPRLQAFFPPEEVRRFQASLQAQGRLGGVAEPFVPVHTALLLGGLAGTCALLVLRWRDRPATALCAVVLVALLANAFSTGALSHPHDRYQARIAWLLLVPPLLVARRTGR